MAGGVGGGEAVINYNSGQTSYFGFGGVQAGFNGTGSVSAYTGFAYGLNDSNSNYSGGFTGINGSVGLAGGFVSRSSGGLQTGFLSNGAWKPAPISSPGAVTTFGLSVGVGTSGASGNVSLTNYSKPLQAGDSGIVTPTDMSAYVAKQVCKALGAQ